MFPLFGSTTTAPARLTARRASSVTAWMRASRVRKTFAPCSGGSSRKIPSIVPSRFPAQVLVHGSFHVRFSFHVSLVKRKFRCFLFIDVVWHADVTQKMR